MDSMCHIIVVLHLVLFASIGEAGGFTQLYVRPTSSPTTICPGYHYLTLDQYMDSANGYITSNSLVKLLPGQHELASLLLFKTLRM